MPAAPDTVPKVFISYSRKDLAAVDALDGALRERGIEALIDRQEIYAFEDWWHRIEALITSADNVVFALSPDAVASDICRREVEFAGQLNKRFAPVVVRAVDPALAPEALNRLNFIHLDRAADFADGVDRLVEALSTDIDWVRRHSEFAQLARRWAEAGRPGPHGLLLRSPMLEEAESWIASRPANAPVPTADTQAIIALSRRAETQRRNRVTAALGLGLAVALLLSGLAFWQRQVARENERIALAAREAEEGARRAETKERSRAEAREREAVEAGEKTLIGQSRFLADTSGRNLADRDAGTAVLLALESLPDRQGGSRRPLVPEARQALERGLAALAERTVAVRHAGFALAFSADGHRLASYGAGELVVADGRTGSIVLRTRLGGGDALSLDLGHDGRRILYCAAGEVVVLDLNTSEQRSLKLGPESGLDGLIACRLDPGGDEAILADRHRRVARWDLRGRPRTVDLPDGLAIAAITRDGRTLVASAPDGEVQIRDSGTGAALSRLTGRGGAVSALEVSLDGRTILILDQQGYRVWDATSNSARDLDAPRHAVAILSPDANRVVLHENWPINSRGGGFEVWDVAGNVRLAVVDATAHLVALSVSQDGKRVAGIAADGALRIYDAETGRELARHLGHQSRGLAVALSPDGRFALSSAFDTRLVLWDLDAKRPSRQVKLGSGQAGGLLPIGDGRAWLAASGRRLLLGDGTDPDPVELADLGGEIASVIPASGGSRVITIRRDGEAVLIDVATRREIARFKGALAPDAFARGVPAIVSPDGSRFVVVADIEAISVRDTATGREAGRFVLPFDQAAGVAFLDDERLVAWTLSGEAVTVDLRKGRVAGAIRNVPLGLNGGPLPVGRGPKVIPWQVVVPSPDGRLLATAGMLQPRLWDGETGRVRHILQDHAMTGMADRMVFGPDGSQLFTVEGGRVVTLWDAESAGRIRSFTGHKAAITSLRVSEDGSLLLTGSEDRSARLWDVASGVELAALTEHDGAVRDAVFWPDGRRIATASDDGSVRFWSFAPDVQSDVDHAKAALGRCLSPGQRRRYFLDPMPPAWCFTGPGLEAKTDATKWQPRAPYHMPLWQNWYRQKQAGAAIPLPRVD